jgi:hypothetical protein
MYDRSSKINRSAVTLRSIAGLAVKVTINASYCIDPGGVAGDEGDEK